MTIIGLTAIAALLSQLSMVSYKNEHLRNLRAMEQYDAQPHDDNGDFTGTFDLS
jgi:hypothetical protein